MVIASLEIQNDSSKDCIIGLRLVQSCLQAEINAEIFIYFVNHPAESVAASCVSESPLSFAYSAFISRLNLPVPVVPVSSEINGCDACEFPPTQRHKNRKQTTKNNPLHPEPEMLNFI
jgi:hypothetical protein